jgi:hypothetical protein
MSCCTCGDQRKEILSLLPRFTTLVGQSSFTTAPVDVCGKETISLQAWRGSIEGGGTFGLFLEQSIDAEHWSPFNATAIDPGTDTVKSIEVCPMFRWFRARVETTGNAQVTCWLEGGMK